MRSTSTWTITLLLAVLLIRPGLGAEPATAPPKAPSKSYRNPLLPDIEIADPFVLRMDGKYYLYPTWDARGYEVFVPGNPIAHRGGTVLGPGHHCIVEGPDGKLWLVYHQKWNADRNFHRFLAIDPIWFDADGILHAKTSRNTDEPAP